MVIELCRAVRVAAAASRRRRPARAAVGVVLALLVTLAAPAAGSDFHIEWDRAGNGIALPGGLWVGGDVTLVGVVPEGQPAVAEFEDVRLLARWEATSRLAFFTELRVEDLVEWVEAEGVDSHDVHFGVERLYAEVLLAPTLTLRLGKVFTPYGLWNPIHRAPLTWTVEEPAVVEELFPTYATGLSLLYHTTWHGWSVDATTYGPAQDTLTSRSADDEGWLAGTRVAAGRPVGAAFGSVGLNAAGFRGYHDSEWAVATGPDLEIDLPGHQLTAELTFHIPAGGGRTVQGLYLQDAIPLAPLAPWARGLYGVLRFEQFQPQHGRSSVAGLVGVFWQPLPSVVLKLDYLFASRPLENLEPGLQTSFSLLF